MKLTKICIEKVIKTSGEGQNGHWERTELLLRDLHSQVETLRQHSKLSTTRTQDNDTNTHKCA